MNKNRFFTTSNIVKTAILGAIAYVLMLLDFPLPFLPPFYKLDFSEVAVLIGGFSMGPLAAIVIEAIKILFKAMTGTSTAYVGEIANFIIGISLAVPASFIYQKNKSKKSAVKGMVIGGTTMTIMGVILNYFVLLPAYSYFYNLPLETIIEMGSKSIPIINDSFSFVLFATTPFNIIKAIVVGIVTVLLYKRISLLLKK